MFRHLALAGALLASSVSVVACSSIAVNTVRQDMDTAVAQKGVPLNVMDGVVGGQYSIQLFYADAYYMFTTDATKSFTSTMSQTAGAFSGLKQEPVPAWFKAKYPQLKWDGIPTR